MPTASLKLPSDIQQNADAAAIDLNITQHTFTAEAIPKAAIAAETHAAFINTTQATGSIRIKLPSA